MARRTAPAIVCEGASGDGCPRPGCPGDAAPQVVRRPTAAPVVRNLCNWCRIDERQTFPLPCSCCGAIGEHVREFSRWWHLHSPRGMYGDCCAVCLLPLPGACMDCIAGPAWVDLAHGRIETPGDCNCWRVEVPDQVGAETPAPVPARFGQLGLEL